MYYAICTSFWISGNSPDENFEEVFSFCINRQNKCRTAIILNNEEKEIISFRKVK